MKALPLDFAPHSACFLATLRHLHKYPCNHCGDVIPWTDLILLRDRFALPEEPTFHVHESCADRFIATHEGNWEKIARDSVEAGWLL